MTTDINRWIGSGNLTRDGEMRATQTGTSVCSFGLASNAGHRNQQTGEWEDIPNFIDCTIFGRQAEALQPYLRKGQKVFIEGELRFSQWEREGQKHSKLEVIVDRLVLAGSKPQQSQGYQQYQQPQQYQQAPQQVAQASQQYQAQTYAQQTYQAPQAPAQAPTYAQAPNQAPATYQQATIPYADDDIPF